jgi:hypothetical protein
LVIDLLHYLHDTYGSFLGPDLLMIAKIGLVAFFRKSSPNFDELSFIISRTEENAIDLWQMVQGLD